MSSKDFVMTSEQLNRCPQAQRNCSGRRRMKRLITVFPLGALLVFMAVYASADAAGDAGAGKMLASKQCAMCHGPDGAGGASAPALKGLAGDRLTSQLQAFKNGTRKNMMMEMVARKLSDKDIADLAAYYSTL